jgi:glycosyltransferase involved in cell wall biosynthesis
VHPSRADTFGLAIAESLSCGTPVITTPLPMHNSLELPLLNAWTLDEFVEEILKIHQIWEKEPKKYHLICELSRKSVKKYDVKNVFNYLRDFFIEISGSP